jgi:hypothetical protein
LLKNLTGLVSIVRAHAVRPHLGQLTAGNVPVLVQEFGCLRSLAACAAKPQSDTQGKPREMAGSAAAGMPVLLTMPMTANV